MRSQRLSEPPPFAGHFGKDVDARTHVFRALVVVGRGREHRVRPVCRALGARAVEGGHREAELAGIAADVVQRDEAVVSVERGVLDAFRRDRRRELLHLHREIVDALSQPGVCILGRFGEQHAAHELENRRVGRVAAAARLRDRPVDVAPVLRRRRVDDVRAIDRKARDDFGERVAQVVQSV